MLQRKDPGPGTLRKISAGLASQGMAPLSGCTPDGLAREVAAHAAHWSFPAKVPALKDRAVLVVTSDDGLARMNDAFAAALRKAGDAHVTTQHFATDHAYSDKRIELSQAVLKWLAGLPK